MLNKKINYLNLLPGAKTKEDYMVLTNHGTKQDTVTKKRKIKRKLPQMPSLRSYGDAFRTSA